MRKETYWGVFWSLSVDSVLIINQSSGSFNLNVNVAESLCCQICETIMDKNAVDVAVQ